MRKPRRKGDEMSDNNGSKRDTLWGVVAWTAAAAAAWAARKAATALWSKLAETEAPANPADRSVTWYQAGGWAALAGGAAGIARVLGRRGAAAAWEGVTGDTPPV